MPRILASDRFSSSCSCSNNNTQIVLKEIFVSEDLVNYIQRLDYEANGYKDIVTTIIRGSEHVKYDEKMYEMHMQKFQEARAAYKIALNELTETYGKEFVGKVDVMVSVDFVAHTLKFIKNER